MRDERHQQDPNRQPRDGEDEDSQILRHQSLAQSGPPARPRPPDLPAVQPSGRDQFCLPRTGGGGRAETKAGMRGPLMLLPRWKLTRKKEGSGSRARSSLGARRGKARGERRLPGRLGHLAPAHTTRCPWHSAATGRLCVTDQHGCGSIHTPRGKEESQSPLQRA